MQNDVYQERLKEFKNLQEEEQKRLYDEYFSINHDELKDVEIIGIASVDEDEKIIMCEEEKNKYLIYNTDDNFYFINTSEEDKELLESTFGTSNYEVVNNHLIIKKDDKALSDSNELKDYHLNSSKEFKFDKDISELRKQALINPNEVSAKANQDLAEKYNLPKDTFNREITVTDIETDENGKSTLTLEDRDTKQKNYLYSEFDEEFTTEVEEKLSFKDSLKLMFEEIKNASAQISMGFMQFYGARFDEEHLNYDPQVILENGEYKISEFNQDGTKTDLRRNLSKHEIDKELESILNQQKSKELEMDKSHELSTELELKQKRNGVE